MNSSLIAYFSHLIPCYYVKVLIDWWSFIKVRDNMYLSVSDNLRSIIDKENATRKKKQSADTLVKMTTFYDRSANSLSILRQKPTNKRKNWQPVNF